MRRKTPYQRIMACARRGTGCRLTADQVSALARDSAIYTVAENDDDPEYDAEGAEIATAIHTPSIVDRERASKQAVPVVTKAAFDPNDPATFHFVVLFDGVESQHTAVLDGDAAIPLICGPALETLARFVDFTGDGKTPALLAFAALNMAQGQQ